MSTLPSNRRNAPIAARCWNSIGVTMDYRPDLTAAEVPAALAAQPYEGLVVRSKLRVTAELLAHGPHLRYVARAGAGIDNIDEAAMAAAGRDAAQRARGQPRRGGRVCRGAAAGAAAQHCPRRPRGAPGPVAARGQPGRGNRRQNHRAAGLRAHGPGVCAAAERLRLHGAGPRQRPGRDARRPRHAGAAWPNCRPAPTCSACTFRTRRPTIIS